MSVPVGVTNQIDTIITTTMKLLEEKGYTDTDRWSEETFDQDYRPVIHEMIEKIYKLGKKEAVERFRKHCCKEVIIAGQKTKIDCCMESLERKKEMLEPTLPSDTPKQDD